MAKGNIVNALHALGLVSLVLFMQRSEATTFTVGGSKGWCVPSDNSPAFNQWAERMRFQIGDSICKSHFIFITKRACLKQKSFSFVKVKVHQL